MNPSIDPNNPSPVQQPVLNPVMTTAAAPVIAPQSKKMSITALILSIAGFLTGFIFFIGGPLAIASIVLGIVNLVKRKPGKKSAITAIIIGGVTLFLLPVSALVVLIAMRSLQESAGII